MSPKRCTTDHPGADRCPSPALGGDQPGEGPGPDGAGSPYSHLEAIHTSAPVHRTCKLKVSLVAMALIIISVHRFPLSRCSSATRLVCHGESGRASLHVEPSKHQAEDEGPLRSGQELINWMEASFQTEQLYRQQPRSDSFCTSKSKQGQTQRSLSSCLCSRLRLQLQFKSCLRLYSSCSSAAV